MFCQCVCHSDLGYTKFVDKKLGVSSFCDSFAVFLSSKAFTLPHKRRRRMCKEGCWPLLFHHSCLDVELTGRVFSALTIEFPATCLHIGQSMDARSTRSRKAIETLSKAINEPILKYLHAMLLSVIKNMICCRDLILLKMSYWNVRQQLKKALKMLTTEYLN